MTLRRSTVHPYPHVCVATPGDVNQVDMLLICICHAGGYVIQVDMLFRSICY